MPTFDAIIVGAGIIGTATARECARAGLRTAIVEQGTVAGGITGAGMGHLVVLNGSAAQLALSAYSQSLWQDEVPAFPAEVEYASRGTLWVAADEEEMAEVHAKHRTNTAAGIESEILTASALGEAEPNLRRNLAGALLVPGDAVVCPPAAAGFFLREAVRLGATLIRSRALSAGHGAVQLADMTSLHAAAIILATGTDCALLAALPLQKRKGHLALTDRYPGFVHHQIVELGYLKSAHTVAVDSVAFNVQPRYQGELLIGSSRQYDNEDAGVDPAMLDRMLRRASSYMPGLANLSIVRTWTGFRAATPDHLPLLGPAAGLSDDATIWISAGYEGLGITSAPAAARLLVDQLLRRPSDIDTTPYLPSRLLTSVAHG